ncbi:MAG: dephospho-CoA kinase [Rhizomicrobium sp.]|jgi:dephospho-CoA kinase
MTKSRPYLVGLTGSIGMGKTETARMFAELSIPVYDADATVHRLYEPGGAAVPTIAKAFPGCVVNGRVDRTALARAVAAEKDGLKRLEAIVHPLVAEDQNRFLHQTTAKGAEMVVLEIPLLFETGEHNRMDAVVVVTAQADVQRARVLDRPGMTEEKLDHILSRQMPDAKKRAQAHFTVETDKGFDHARVQVKEIVAALHARRLREQSLA